MIVDAARAMHIGLLLNRARCLLATLCLILSGALALPEDAKAYPQAVNECNDPSIRFTFRTRDYAWPAGPQNLVAEAIFNLSGIDHDGSYFFSLSQIAPAEPNPDVIIYLDDLGSGSYGSAECTAGATISINGRTRSSEPNSYWWKIGAHEMLHLMGAEHGGGTDSLSGNNPPHMATCVSKSTFRNSPYPTDDDRNHFAYLHDSFTRRQVTSNMGFEEGKLGWSTTGDIIDFTVLSSSGMSGNRVARVNMPGLLFPDNYLYRRSRILTGDDNENYDAYVDLKASSAASASEAIVELWERPLYHPLKDMSCPGYPDGLGGVNVNATPTVGPWTRRGTRRTFVDSSTSGVRTPAANVPSDSSGHDFEVRFRGYARGGETGGYVPLYVDNLHASGS